MQALLGFQSLTAGRLLTGEAGLAQGMAGLKWRLFDFGRVDAEVAAARGAEGEAFANWCQAVLSAANVVENALAQQAAPPPPCTGRWAVSAASSVRRA